MRKHNLLGYESTNDFDSAANIYRHWNNQLDARADSQILSVLQEMNNEIKPRKVQKIVTVEHGFLRLTLKFMVTITKI